MLLRIAGNSSINTPTANMPMPASTLARSAILISATRMPSIITSVIAQGRERSAQRSMSPTQLGAGGRRTASSTINRKEQISGGGDDRAKGHDHGGHLLPLNHIW
jgi:hypothetical protein